MLFMYKLCVYTQVSLGNAFANSNVYNNLVLKISENPGSDTTLSIVWIIVIIYAFFKVFFGNIKRGGILITLVCIGALYMYSIPRGFWEGFIGWCKQIIALCVTAFLQNMLLIVGALIFPDNMLIGVGIMMASTEVPRIAGQFGLDSSAKANISTSLYTANSAVNVGKMLLKSAR